MNNCHCISNDYEVFEANLTILAVVSAVRGGDLKGYFLAEGEIWNWYLISIIWTMIETIHRNKYI